MIPIFLDTETTGLDPEDRLIQIAYKRRHLLVNEFFSAPVPIKLSAMAVSGITEKDIAGKPKFEGSSVQEELLNLLKYSNEYVLVAHNAQFDVEMLEKEGIKPQDVICTKKLIQHLDEEAKLESYSLQYLRYYFGIDIEAYAHDALGDILVLEQVFWKLKDVLFEKEIPEDIYARMMEITSQPTLIRRFNFGKHKGELVKDVDPSYLDWLLNQKLASPEGEEDWIYTLRHFLGR